FDEQAGAPASRARFGPATPKHPPGLLLVVYLLNRFPFCHTLFAAERPSSSARERVPRRLLEPPKGGDRTLFQGPAGSSIAASGGLQEAQLPRPKPERAQRTARSIRARKRRERENPAASAARSHSVAGLGPSAR